jgi:putative GTP pyrophosphokinase
MILKLKRFSGMQLARMQDIGRLRAVVNTVSQAGKLETAYRTASFQHELLTVKSYIDHPKEDGYRRIHLIYRYRNSRAREYDALSLEIQMRTKLQHAWATAVETMGTFLGQALKSGEARRNGGNSSPQPARRWRLSKILHRVRGSKIARQMKSSPH